MKATTLWQPWAQLVALGVKTIETRSWRTSYRGPLAIHAGLRRPPMMHLPETRFTRDRTEYAEVDEHNGRCWLVIDTITDPAHQRPHRTDIRDRVPRRSTSPTLFYPHRGPWGGRPRNEQGGAADPAQPVTLVLPLGAVVATCTLTDVIPIGDEHSFSTGIVEGEPCPTADQDVIVYHKLDDSLVLDRWNKLNVGISQELPFGDYRPGRWAWLLEDIRPLDEPIPARGHQGLWEWKP